MINDVSLRSSSASRNRFMMKKINLSKLATYSGSRCRSGHFRSSGSGRHRHYPLKFPLTTRCSTSRKSGHCISDDHSGNANALWAARQSFRPNQGSGQANYIGKYSLPVARELRRARCRGRRRPIGYGTILRKQIKFYGDVEDVKRIMSHSGRDRRRGRENEIHPAESGDDHQDLAAADGISEWKHLALPSEGDLSCANSPHRPSADNLGLAAAVPTAY